MAQTFTTLPLTCDYSWSCLSCPFLCDLLQNLMGIHFIQTCLPANLSRWWHFKTRRLNHDWRKLAQMRFIHTLGFHSACAHLSHLVHPFLYISATLTLKVKLQESIFTLDWSTHMIKNYFKKEMINSSRQKSMVLNIERCLVSWEKSKDIYCKRYLAQFLQFLQAEKQHWIFHCSISCTIIHCVNRAWVYMICQWNKVCFVYIRAKPTLSSICGLHKTLHRCISF